MNHIFQTSVLFNYETIQIKKLIDCVAGSYDIHPRHNKMARESNIWCPSVKTSVQHFTKRS